MKTVEFYYVRHGETLFNVLDKMQGWCDSPLTENGIKDAERAHDILKDIPLTKAYTSTSERCRDTCALVLKGRNVPVFETKGLKEINFGTFEAIQQSSHMDEIGPRRQALHWEDVGGDSYETFSTRIRNAFQKINDECEDGDHVLIVSHGAVWLWMQKIILGLDMETFRKTKEEKGLPMMPNGYNGTFVCEDGVFRLTGIPGMTKEEVAAMYERNDGNE
ncbi:MAG: histidine phosphatase family protein [Solobacterium sp.]|nr:histidine phosphatase family protein [Solobacterium sp.]